MPARWRLARACPGDRAVRHFDGAARRLAQAGERLDELVLAVAGDAGDAEDLARPDVEADALDGLVSAVVRDMQVRDDESRIGWVRFTAVDDELDVAADHQGREIVLVGFRRNPRAHDLAPSDDGDPVGDLQHLVQLVADEDDRVALRGEAPEDLEDLLGLLRRQHGGRLVEDEDPCLPVQRLQDLDPLLPADRQRADLDIGVDVEPEPLAELDDPAMGLVPVQEDRIRHRLLAEEDVVGDGQDRDQHEVLVDHADAARDRVGGAADRDGFPVQRDLTLVGRGQPVQDVHQGRLPGAVLAEQRVDLARPHVEVDRIVCDDARISLRDAAHLQRGGGHDLGHGGLRLQVTGNRGPEWLAS